jgi:hypothetical protein
LLRWLPILFRYGSDKAGTALLRRHAVEIELLDFCPLRDGGERDG